MHNVRYISDLRKALRETGILADNVKVCNYKLKDKFKNSNFYQKGILFKNKFIDKNLSEVRSVLPSIKGRSYSFDFSSGDYGVSLLFDNNENDIHISQNDKSNHTQNKIFTIKEVAEKNYSLVHKALRAHPFFALDNLKTYYPNLSSLREFLTSEAYIGSITLNIKYSFNQLDPSLLLKVLINNVFNEISDLMSKKVKIGEGSKEFYAVPIKTIIKDTAIQIALTNAQTGIGSNYDGVGIAQSSVSNSNLKLDVSNEPWFVFSEHYGTEEEKELVVLFKSIVSDLTKKYKDVYLIRNEKQLKLYSFKGGEGFEPDFILILSGNQNEHPISQYIFIEPKGQHLMQKDQWKENFLLSLEKEALISPQEKSILAENEKYVIKGLRFYNVTINSEYAKLLKEL